MLNINTIKQQTYFNLANKLGDNSMFVKVLFNIRSSYVVYDEDNELELLYMRVIGLYNYIINYVTAIGRRWAVHSRSRKSSNQNIRNIQKYSKHLSTNYGGNNKNSGSSGNRNVLR